MRMKKLVSLALAAVLSCAVSMTALAAGSPEVSGVVNKVSKAVDKNGNAVEVTIKETSKEIAQEIKNIDRLKEVLAEAGVKFVEGMKVADVKDVVVPEGTEFPVTITFPVAGVTASTNVAVLHHTGSAWEVVDSKAGDGTITATFTSLSPVAFVIDENTMDKAGTTSEKAPRTGEGMFVPMAIAVAALAGCGVVAFRKKAVR